MKNPDAYLNTYLDWQTDPWSRVCLFYKWVVIVH